MATQERKEKCKIKALCFIEIDPFHYLKDKVAQYLCSVGNFYPQIVMQSRHVRRHRSPDHQGKRSSYVLRPGIIRLVENAHRSDRPGVASGGSESGSGLVDWSLWLRCGKRSSYVLRPGIIRLVGNAYRSDRPGGASGGTESGSGLVSLVALRSMEGSMAACVICVPFSPRAPLASSNFRKNRDCSLFQTGIGQWVTPPRRFPRFRPENHDRGRVVSTESRTDPNRPSMTST